ncbi:MAG: ABC transporter substrate-binding protein [Aigarchaeota archaeon]|nr:ABC transporter substrate-binding protein [Aigarchaeota archaeon]MDW8092805.1 ABC transporter substrate-binding protein [Nitrososphaerota archaeon]
MNNSKGLATNVVVVLWIVFLVIGAVAGYIGGSSAGASTTTITVRETRTTTLLTTVVAGQQPPATPTTPGTQQPPTQAPPTQDQQRVVYPQSLIDAARREGRLVVYTTMPADQFDKLMTRFRQKFPGIEIEFWRGTIGDLVVKMLSEYRGGVYYPDVVFGIDEGMTVLHREGVLTPRPPEVVLPENFSSDLILDIGYSVRRVFFVIMYNTQLVPSDRAPRSLEDLARPEWRNRLVLPDFTIHAPTIFYLMMVREMWGERKFWDWMRGVLANRPLWRASPLPAAVAVEVGEAAVCITFSSNIAPALSRRSPVDWVYLNPFTGSTTPITMASKALRPNAAKLFITYVVHEGGSVFQEIGDLPITIDPNFPVHPAITRIPPDLKWVPNKIYPDEERLRFVEAVRTLMAEIR